MENFSETLDDIQISIRLKHVNFMTDEPTQSSSSIPPRRKQSERIGQRVLISGWIHTKRLIGWVEKYFVLWNDLKLIYYSSNNQQKLQANLAIYSRGKHNWTKKATRTREGCFKIIDYDCFIPAQPKASFPRLHLHHQSDPKQNLYLSFKDESTRNSWAHQIEILKKHHEPPLGVYFFADAHYSERKQTLFSSMDFDEDLDTGFISTQQLKDVFKQLPIVFQFSRLVPAFCTRLDGISFQTMYNEIMDYPTLLVIDAHDIIISVFLPKCQRRFFGTNTDFRFALMIGDKVEVSSPDASEMISLICERDIIGISCGPNKRFCLGKDMAHGQFAFELSESFLDFKCRSMMAFILSDDEQTTEVCA